MKILHITNCLSEGGVETFLYSLSKFLVLEGHSVTVLVMSCDKIALKKQFEDIGINVIVGKYKNVYNPFNIWEIRRHLQFYDIVHVHLFPNQIFAVLANMSLNKPIRLLTTEHSTWNNRRKYRLLKIVDRLFYRQYKYVIGISDDTTSELQRWLQDEKMNNRIVTINNGVDVPDYYDDINIQCWIKSNQAFIVTMVARFNVPKDYDTLICSMSLLPENVHAILVGSGETLEKSKQLAHELGISKRIHFVGYRSDVFSILKQSHLGVLSSNWEGFGLSVVEYMLAGLPVLASNVLGLGKIVGWNDLLFKPKDAQELADKILQMMNNPEYYKKAKAYCVNRAQEFSVKKMVDKYLLIYEEINR